MKSLTTTALKLALVGACYLGCGGISKDDPDGGSETSQPPSDPTTITPTSGDVSVDPTTDPPSATADTGTSSLWVTTSAAETESVVTTSEEFTAPVLTTESSTASDGATNDTTLAASTRGVETSDTSAEPNVGTETQATDTVYPETSSPTSEPAATAVTPGDYTTDATSSDSASTTGDASTHAETLVETTDDATSTGIFYSTVENGPPFGIDWLSPPSGVPFDLPAEYDFTWKTVDEDDVIYEWHDATQCALTFAGDWGPGGIGQNPLGFVECDTDAGSDWNCRCYKNSDYYDWSVIPAHFVETSDDNGDACLLGAALCLTDLPANDPSCYDANVWLGYSARSCLRDDRCDYRHPTPHGEIVTSELLPFIECATYEGPEYYCLGTHIAGFDFEGIIDAVPRSFHDTCDLAYEVFFNGVDSGSAGELNCAQVGRTTVKVNDGRESSCEARYQCRRPATALGEAIEMVYQSNTVQCSQSTDGWRCSCGGEYNSYKYTGVDGVTACQTILDECMTHPIP